MNILKSLLGIKENQVQNSALNCPNCWGKQSYEGEFIKVTNDRTKSSINKEKGYKKTFVQKFVERNITGVRLKKDGDILACPKCNGRYKYVSAKAN